MWVSATDGFSIAHLKEVIVSVECLGNTLSGAVARLREMMERNFSSDEFKTKIGFSKD